MSRKVFPRNLPGLDRLFPNFSGFENTANKRYQLELALREAVLNLRGTERMNFYSMREISNFFNISLKSVSVVFERLSKEGYFTIIRGSHTVMEGIRTAPKSGLRGVVGIPVALPSFVFGPNPRSFFIKLENELRHRGYVVDFIFYSVLEADEGELLDRLRDHEMDIAFWMSPVRAAGEIMLRLRDLGVKLVVVGDTPGMFPVQQYVLDLAGGFAGVADKWRSLGIKEILLIGPEKSLAPQFRQLSWRAFQSSGFVVHDKKVDAKAFFEAVGDYRALKQTGIVFLEYFHYEELCNEDWKAMAGLFKERRTLLAQGIVYHGAFAGRSILVDILNFDFDQIARRIAYDISGQNYRKIDGPHVFPAQCAYKCDLGTAKRVI